MNAKRVRRIQRIIRSYSELAGLTKADGKATPVIDLLADLNHYCKANNIDFDDALGIATNHCTVERCTTSNV